MQMSMLRQFFGLWLMPILVFQSCYIGDDILLNQWNAVQYCPSGMEFLRKAETSDLSDSVFEHDRPSCTFSRPGTFGSQELQRKLWVTSMLFKMKCWKCLVISSGFQYDFLNICTLKSKTTSLLKWMWIFYPLNSTQIKT